MRVAAPEASDARFCDHFHVLNDGKIIQSGLFRELYEEASGSAPKAAMAGVAPPCALPPK